MSLLAPRRAALGAALSLVLLTLAGPAYGDELQQCMDKAIDHGGVPPTCTEVNGKWIASWPDDGGIPGGFVVLFIFGIIVAIGITVWKVSTARRLATESGMDPTLATQMTLLTENGLDSTYLAANLRQPASAPAAPPTAPASSTADRLTELKGLLESGMVTQAEYDERRKAIIDSV